MIEFLYKLFIGHRHQWEIKEEYEIYQKEWDYTFSNNVKNIGKGYVQVCKHCGKINHVKTYA